jgi:hypothetical protein
MHFDLSSLRQAIEQSDRQTLSDLLVQGLEQLDANNQFELFADLYEQQVVSQWSDEKVLDAVKSFHKQSLQGRFFDHSWGDDGRYDAITPLTQSWYDEAGFWLDVLCSEHQQRSKACRLQGIRLLLELIDRLDEEVILVPHDTLGEENILTRSDFREYHRQLQQ